MHAPDGLLNAAASAGAGAVSLGAIAAALKQSKRELGEKAVPLAGITAAFVFAAQMFNFPVAAGASGHLMGGALAAVLLGPSAGAVVVTVVVTVQALAFADGGLTALGVNVLNMAVVPAYGGYAAFRLFRRRLPRSTGGVVAAAGLAAWSSVVLAAAAFSLEWLFGATAPVAFDTVFGAMVGAHALIGVGEGLISAVALSAVMASRPDLVRGASDLTREEISDRRPVKMRTFVIGALIASVTVAGVVSQLSSDAPDGLEKTAAETGMAADAEEHALSGSPFAEYATEGIDDKRTSLAAAGVAGALIALSVGAGIAAGLRGRGPERPARRL